MKVIKTKEIANWSDQTKIMLGFTQKQLVDYVSLGSPFKMFCVEQESEVDSYEIFIEIENNDPRTPNKRMVLISHRKERKFFKAQTACRFVFKTLGLKEVAFWSFDKRREEGLLINEKLEVVQE